MKVLITKMYLVQVLDEEGNELSCEYVCGDRKAAEQVGRNLKEEQKEIKEGCD